MKVCVTISARRISGMLKPILISRVQKMLLSLLRSSTGVCLSMRRVMIPGECVRHHAVLFYLSDAYVVYVRWACIFLYSVSVLSKSHGQNGFSRNVSNLWSPHLSYVVCTTSDCGCGSGSLESIMLQFFFQWWKRIHDRKHFLATKFLI